MKERPILFSTEMVRAILDGRKTQTRRSVYAPREDLNHPAVSRWQVDQEHRAVAVAHSEEVAYQFITTFPHYRIRCPYGVPGDRLWVRETWCQKTDDDDRFVYNAEGNLDPSCCWYKASNPEVVLCPGLERGERKDGSERSPWSPSIHMPRWASRITLEVTDVRVQRVQEISEADAIAEGCPDYRADPQTSARFDQTWQSLSRASQGEIPACPAVDWIRKRWDSINAKRGYAWKSNPWVWAITFKVVKP